ncbi:hypothetical protein Zmor_027209 [Zophobas morio]|uniref:Adenomatous polyposis coli protein n=2 Tax=Zophobas morio TaxID=2755281 RepID=A0AA38HPG4_9CUCU|nr:hypothetical protein Zmor_027209 [Zophobas morio]
MEPLLAGKQHNGSSTNCDGAATSSADGDTTCSEDEYVPGRLSATHLSVSSEPVAHRDHLSMLYHGTWPVERTMWNSDPISRTTAPVHNPNMQDVTSVMSFASSSGGALLGSPSLSRRSSQQLEAKVDMVYSLLAMLSGQEHADMGETLLALSTNPESCLAMRQSGCIPLLVQMVQSDKDPEARKKASQALQNLVHSQPDEKLRKREVRVFKLLENTRGYTEALRNHREFELEVTSSSSEDDDKHPVQTVAHLMKLSFDELHRQAICSLGGIHSIASLVEAEHVNHGSTADEQHCILMRRYACMALTNLTFGDSGNKALLCSFREFMRALVIQLQSPSDELRQVTASVLRNLSWRADSTSKEILREVGSVTGLMKAAMLDNKENTLKSILSALWNLSAHCTENKSEICSVECALGFLVDMLTYKTVSKSLAIIENSGGILRNVSSQIAVRDDYREVLRQHNCLQILLDQLKSPSLTIVSNACGTLWNLSAKCPQDQEALWQMGAPAMLRSLNHSKHKMIAMGSSAALKNLLSARPTQTVPTVLDSTALAMDLPVLPTLGARKQKALLQDLDQTLSETYENIEKDSPVKTKDDKHIAATTHDFIQKSKKYSRQSSDNSPEFKYSDYETDFCSLTEGEPSTSYETKQNLSLPYLDNSVSSNDLNKNCFVKSRRNASENDNRTFNVYSDSGLQSLESPVKFDLDSGSTSSIDNDKCKKQFKLKEVSVYSDEKDHCSIEDVSDSDNQSSLGFEHKVHDESSFLSSGLIARKEVPHSSGLSTPTLPHPNFKYPNLASSNVTMFEGNIDEIDMDDISIHFASEQSKDGDDDTEKRDVENEKKSHLQEIVEESTSENRRLTFPKTSARGSGIPLPRSLPRPIPNSNVNHQTIDLDSPELPVAKKINKSNIARLSSGLPRRNLQTSTPLRITGNARRGEGSSEAFKVENIDMGDDSSVSPIVKTDESKVTSTDIDCSLPEVEFSSSSDQTNLSPQDLHHHKPPPTPLNFDQMEKPKVSSPTDFSYLSPEACVNFNLKHDRDRLLERSCEENNLMDNRMLDPDAMIESLDRFTAELVSQASHLQSNGEDKYKDNTWNEDTSPNEVTFPSISGSAPNVITFGSNESSVPETSDEKEKEVEKERESEHQSNDFSSINTNTSTMTESTLIAIEATKMATVFKTEAEMSHSISSVASLELDKVQPPSLLDSMSLDLTKSPKLTARKKSLPKALMVKRALSNSLNNGSSLESLENHSLSNLDQVNPPSAMAEVLDMEGSITSVASLPSENNELKTDFVINGSVNKNNSFLTSRLSHVVSNVSNLNSVTDLENINPPSLFNEITDLCNSLADVPTEAIGSETEMFEDCHTHVLPTEDDVTEFSDANSATPIQSDVSSPEVSPKKNKSIKKPMTLKQRRNLARDRYKTYTIAAEMLTREEDEKQSTSEDFNTVNCSPTENYYSVIDTHTYSVKSSEKLTPKQKRQNDRSRFETQVVEEAVTELLQQPVIESSSPREERGDETPQSSPGGSPARTKLSIRRNFMQKRLENRDRFKTQTLTEASFSPELSASPEADLHLLVQREANLVLKSLRETKTSTDELLECETLSLVSNDDDSEHNSGSPINYRTYHKSWGLTKNIPVIDPPPPPPPVQDRLPSPASDPEPTPDDQPAKPKITKPSEKPPEEEPPEEEPQGKAIRGRRKPLYSKSTSKIAPKTPLKPLKNMTSNLVKNVTSSIKQVKQTKPPAKPPTPQSRASSGYGTRSSSPKTGASAKPKLERQGTFTKEEPAPAAPRSRIPTPGSAKTASKIPAKARPATSASSDRVAVRNTRTGYARSTSADSTRRAPNAASVVKRASIPTPSQRSGSNTSLNTAATNTKKQVTSKIASLWKKIEESKKQPAKKDTRVWIQNPGEGGLTRSNTFDNKNGVTLRGKKRDGDDGKRVSRLGSFIVMDDTEEGVRMQQVINAE